MKKYVLFAITLCAPLWLAAQEPEPRQRYVPRGPGSPPGVTRPGVTRPRVAPPRRNPAWRKVKNAPPRVPLPEDVVLHVHGSFQGQFPFDLELPAGRGPNFENTKTMTGVGPEEKSPPILRIKAAVTEVDGGYRVEYQIGARIAFVPNRPKRPNRPKPQVARGRRTPPPTHIALRDFVLQGSVLVKPGKAVVIGKFKGKELSLTVSKSIAEPVEPEGEGDSGGAD